MISGILFDKDGTLFDLDATYGSSTLMVINKLAENQPEISKKLAKSIDYDLETNQIDPQSIIVAGTPQNISETFAPHLPEYDYDTLLRLVDKYYIEYSLDCIEAFHDTEPTLLTLKDQGYFLGVATNDTQEAAKQHLKKSVLDKYFSFFVGSNSGYGAKPRPCMIQAFAQHCQIEPKQIAMIGDSMHDLRAANAAGSLAIGVTTGLTSEAELIPFADHIISSLSELPKLIEHINN